MLKNKFFLFLFFFFLLLIFLFVFVLPKKTEPEVLFFYSRDCPYSAAMIGFLTEIIDKYPEIKIRQFEITTNQANRAYFEKEISKRGLSSKDVPALLIEDKAVVGFKDRATTGKEIERYFAEMIYKYQEEEEAKEPIDKTKFFSSIALLAMIIVFFILVFRKKRSKM